MNNINLEIELIEKDFNNYIEQILDGSIIANLYIKNMVQRHLNDLKNTESTGFYFDITAGAKVILFSRLLSHSKGIWAGKKVELEQWQKTIILILFGWKKSNGYRRFKTSYLEVARKNGKTFLAACIGLYMMIADGEAGSECYSAATKTEQAKIVFDEVKNIIHQSKLLSKRISVNRSKLFVENTNTKFIPLSKQSRTLDGLNVHCAIVDELHAHVDSSVTDVLVTATGNRKQPLIFAITTAGFDKESYCYSLREYAIAVVNGEKLDDSFFAAIFTLDSGDDWMDENVWCKANPNLNVTVDIEGLKDLANRAKSIASDRVNFLTKNLNMWVDSSFSWLNSNDVKACSEEIDESLLKGRICYAGLDLSNTLDLTALVYIFPPIKGETKPILISRCWIPQGKLNNTKGVKDTSNYEQWVRHGYVNVIEGDVIDYEAIYKTIREDAKNFKIKMIGYDSWGSSAVYNTLSQENFDMVSVGQGYKSLSPPMKEFEKLIISKQIRLDNNPVFQWNCRNVIGVSDPSGNIKPDKSKSKQKIDLVVAALMALNIYMSQISIKPKEYRIRTF